jgi:PPOX class probable F420-dependent enzyme
MSTAPPAEYAHLLDRALFAHVAVTAPDGTPRSYPMWFVWEDGVLRFTNTDGRPQTRFLRERPHLALSIVDPDNPYRYLQLRCTLEGIERDPTGAFYQRLQQRYRGHTSEVRDKDVRVILTFRPTGFKVR